MRKGAWVLIALFAACGQGGAQDGSSSNRARFTFDCDLQGLNGVLRIDVEAVGASGVAFGSGSDPDITGIIATGEVIYETAGDLRSPTAAYTFTGENQYADFTSQTTFERFRVEWQLTGNLLIMIVNPFGPGPTQYTCVPTSAMYL